MKLGTTFATGLLGVLAGAALVGGVVWARDDGGGATTAATVGGQTPISSTKPVSDNGSTTTNATSSNGDFTALYDAVRPSVVRITTGTDASNPLANSGGGLGSGIVLDSDGHILTNYHVVRGFDTVMVTFSDQTVVQGNVVGKDPGDDVAVVQVKVSDASVLKPAKLGDSSKVKVGSVVAAIGNPFGLDGTFTTGVISGLDRTLPSSSDGRPIRGLLQTDTAVNPGNSGGALINLQGEVIGINTAIENPGGNSFAGVAYAVPVNIPKRFLTQLTAGADITHARLGISGRTLTADDMKTLGVDHGVGIVTVERGSAGEKAGLKSSTDGKGDVITAIDGKPVKTFEDVADYIDSKSVGDQVNLSVHRDGKDTEITATLKSWDSSA